MSVGVAARCTATALVVAAAGLLLWSLLPLLLGWNAHVVVGGSMQPRVSVGDVLMSQRLDPARLRPGMVLVFRDPTDPDRVVTHRLREVGGDGLLTTRGDANAVDDAQPVTPADVIGVARLQVPLVGLPRHWAQTGQWLPLGTAAAVLLAAAGVMAGGGPEAQRGASRAGWRPEGPS